MSIEFRHPIRNIDRLRNKTNTKISCCKAARQAELTADEVKTRCEEQLGLKHFQELQKWTEKCLKPKEISTGREFQVL